MRQLLFLLTIALPIALFGQNEFKQWYFGRHTGLNFKTSPPSVINHTTLNTFEGSASIADAQGNLLFYTDGSTVWNKQHLVMANGTGLKGNGTTVQAAIIVQKPSSACIYYVFTLDAQGWPNGLNYSEVDICSNAGFGSVTTKNVPLHTPCTEHLAAVRHCNRVDVWVVSHDFNSNTFLSYLVTSAGVNTTAVSSVVGPTVSSFGQGTIKFSPSGKKMGFTGFNWIPKIVTLFDFDISTGTVTNPLTVLSTTNMNCYGCEFSPDNSKFYTAGASSVIQWNLCAGSSSAIVSSQITVGSTPSSGQLQLAPDGRIYVVRWGTQMLDAIFNPDGIGTSCNFSTMVQSVATGSNGTGLPNFMAGVFKNLPSFTYTINPLLSCATASFTSPSLNFTNSACASTTYSFASMSWDFGHPASGSSNTSTLSNPTHNYGVPGTYYPKLLLHYACGTDTVRDTVVIPGPTVTVQSANMNCSTPGTATVNVSGGSGQYQYVWLPGGMTASVVPVNPSTYTVKITDLSGNCTYTVNHTFAPPVPFTGTVVQTNSIACFGQSTGGASLNVSPGTGGPSSFSYSWSTGSTTNTATGLAAGAYWVTSQNGLCTLTKTIQITQPAALSASITLPTGSVCAYKTITLSAMVSGGTPAMSFAWTSGQTTGQIIQSPAFSNTYSNQVTVTDKNGCKTTATATLGILNNPLPVVQDMTVCTKTTLTLTASGPGTYTWMPGNVTSHSLVITPQATSIYTVTSAQTNSCVNSRTVSVFVSSCIGLNELDKNKDLVVFPNPATDILTLFVVEKTEIAISTQSGSRLFHETFEAGLYQVSVHDWPKGVYLLESSTESMKSVQKLIVGE